MTEGKAEGQTDRERDHAPNYSTCLQMKHILTFILTHTIHLKTSGRVITVSSFTEVLYFTSSHIYELHLQHTSLNNIQNVKLHKIVLQIRCEIHNFIQTVTVRPTRQQIFIKCSKNLEIYDFLGIQMNKRVLG